MSAKNAYSAVKTSGVSRGGASGANRGYVLAYCAPSPCHHVNIPLPPMMMSFMYRIISKMFDISTNLESLPLKDSAKLHDLGRTVLDRYTRHFQYPQIIACPKLVQLPLHAVTYNYGLDSNITKTLSVVLHIVQYLFVMLLYKINIKILISL